MKHFYHASAALFAAGVGLLCAACIGCGSSNADGTSASIGRSAGSKKSPLSQSGSGHAAMRRASESGKYLFAFFWKEENEQTAALRKVFEEAMGKAKDRADTVAIKMTDDEEKPFIKMFNLEHAPMPLVLAIASNGAVMGGFPKEFTEEALLNAFGSPATEKCMKNMQEGNLVFLCVQNASTASNEGAMKGVKAFAEDSRYSEATRIVMLDPSDPAEKAFLSDLKIDPQTAEAVTAFMVPPGSAVMEFKGATDKDELIAALQKAGTSCGPGGCGPGGCGPKK
jgi:hypothetical protein